MRVEYFLLPWLCALIFDSTKFRFWLTVRWILLNSWVISVALVTFWQLGLTAHEIPTHKTCGPLPRQKDETCRKKKRNKTWARWAREKNLDFLTTNDSSWFCFGYLSKSGQLSENSSWRLLSYCMRASSVFPKQSPSFPRVKFCETHQNKPVKWIQCLILSRQSPFPPNA